MRPTHTGPAEQFHAPGAPGYAFKDGKLYAFRRDRVVVLRGGDQPATWTKSAARPTWHSSPRLAVPALKAALRHPNRPQYQAVGLVRDCPVLGDGQLAFASFRPQFSSDLALAAFRVTIPTAIRERLRQLGFGGRQWDVYSLLARCPGALDLFDSNPALAFALANARAFHRVSRPLESVRRLLRRRQRESLGYLAATFRDLPDHFPPPPVLPATGCSGIRPITSPKELYQHAEKEHNCAFSFSEAISQGQYYIYAVDHPVRATLSFVRGENGWVLCDVLGPANTALPEWTREYVLSAFDELPAARQGAEAEISAVCLEDSRTPFD